MSQEEDTSRKDARLKDFYYKLLTKLFTVTGIHNDYTFLNQQLEYCQNAVNAICSPITTMTEQVESELRFMEQNNEWMVETKELVQDALIRAEAALDVQNEKNIAIRDKKQQELSERLEVLANSKKEHDAVMAYLKQEQDEIAKLQETLNEEMCLNEKYKNELDGITQSESQIPNLSTEFESITDAFKQLDEKIDAEQAENDEICKSNAIMKEELAAITDSCHQKSLEVAKMQDKLDKMKKTHKKEDRKFKKIESKLQSRLQKEMNEEFRLQMEMAEIENTTEQLKKAIEKCNADIKFEIGDHDTLEDATAQANADLMTLDLEYKDFESRTRIAQWKNEDLQLNSEISDDSVFKLPEQPERFNRTERGRTPTSSVTTEIFEENKKPQQKPAKEQPIIRSADSSVEERMSEGDSPVRRNAEHKKRIISALALFWQQKANK